MGEFLEKKKLPMRTAYIYIYLFFFSILHYPKKERKIFAIFKKKLIIINTCFGPSRNHLQLTLEWGGGGGAGGGVLWWVEEVLGFGVRSRGGAKGEGGGRSVQEACTIYVYSF